MARAAACLVTRNAAAEGEGGAGETAACLLLRPEGVVASGRRLPPPAIAADSNSLAKALSSLTTRLGAGRLSGPPRSRSKSCVLNPRSAAFRSHFGSGGRAFSICRAQALPPWRRSIRTASEYTSKECGGCAKFGKGFVLASKGTQSYSLFCRCQFAFTALLRFVACAPSAAIASPRSITWTRHLSPRPDMWMLLVRKSRCSS